MAGPANFNLTVQQGATFRANFLVNNADGTPATLTGVSAQMIVKPSYTGEAIITLSSPSNGITVGANTDPVGNQIDITISNTQTAALEVPGNQLNSTGQPYVDFVYDLFITMPSGDVYKQAYGTFTVVGSVSVT